MWNTGMNTVQSQQQQPPPPIHQHPPHHLNTNNNNNNNNLSLHLQQPQQQQQQQLQNNTNNTNNNNTASSEASLRSSDLHSWCEAFDKHELVDILVKISKINSKFQSYLGHAFVTDIKWCKIRVQFIKSNNNNNNKYINNLPSSNQIAEYFNKYGKMRRIEYFKLNNYASITFNNYTFAQAVVSVGIHYNICNTVYNASCCYEFESNEIPQQQQHQQHQQQHQQHHQQQQQLLMQQRQMNSTGVGGPLEQRRIFVSSLSYNTSDCTLENVFSQYGDLEDCTIVKDKLTNKSKGYGFVVFKNVYGAINALKQSEKFIDGRRTRSWLAAQGNNFRKS